MNSNPKTCACGCGNPIIFKEYHNKYPVKFISGHNGVGKPTWCKGLTKETDERLKKAAKKRTKKREEYVCLFCKKEFLVRPSGIRRKYCSLDCRHKDQIGDNNPAKRLESRKKISDKLIKMYKDGTAKCGFKKGELKKETHRKNISISVSKAYEEGRLNNSLENHPNWQDGKSKEEYGFDFTKDLKQQIKDRDNFKCQICSEHPSRLCVHHIDYNKKNCNSNNLISLCEVCHGKTNYKRQDWTNYFNEKSELISRGHDVIGTSN